MPPSVVTTLLREILEGTNDNVGTKKGIGTARSPAYCMEQLGLKHVEDPLTSLAKAGLGLLSQGLGRCALDSSI